MTRATDIQAADVIAFLGDNGFLGGDSRPAVSNSRRIGSIRPDTSAWDDSLSWISDRLAREVPERLTKFAGALLIAPADLALPPAVAPRIVRCTNPRLAFSHVVHHFFPQHLVIEWPAAAGSFGPRSVVDPHARLAPGVVIGSDCRIEANVSIGPNTVLANAVVESGTSIGANCSIGLPGYGYERDDTGVAFRFPHIGGVRIGSSVEIGSNTCIDRGALGDTLIGDGCKIDNLVHIAHNVELGSNCMVIANSMIAGSVKVEKGAWVAPSASVLQSLTVGEGAFIGLGAVVIRPVQPHTTVVGNPARELTKT